MFRPRSVASGLLAVNFNAHQSEEWLLMFSCPKNSIYLFQKSPLRSRNRWGLESSCVPGLFRSQSQMLLLSTVSTSVRNRTGPETLYRCFSRSTRRSQMMRVFASGLLPRSGLKAGFGAVLVSSVITARRRTHRAAWRPLFSCSHRLDRLDEP